MSTPTSIADAAQDHHVVEFANFFFSLGESATDVEGGWIRDTLTLRLPPFTVTLKQLEAGRNWDPSVHQARATHTTSADFGVVSDPDSANEAAHDLGWLLSFATMSEVGPFAFPGRRTSFLGRACPFRPPFGGGRAIREFVEKCWAGYRRDKLGRKLPVCFHYMVNATPATGLPLEAETIFLVITCESLKHTHAVARGYVQKKGFFYDGSGNRLNFGSLLKEALADVGMTTEYKRIVAVRNDMVHTGLSAQGPSALIAEVDFLHQALREYFLRLMDFTGAYQQYAGGNAPARIQ